MSDWLKQTQRMLQLSTPTLANDPLILQQFSGAEGLSQLFSFALNTYSRQTAIAPALLLGKAVTIQLNYEAEKPRHFHGYVEQFVAGEIIEGVRHYQLQLMPWLKFLSYTSDCRIFQHKSVVELTRLIFAEFKFSAYDLSGLSQQYPALDYCVQYSETTFNFLARLWQQAGIFYYFTHGKGQHVLHLADQTSALKAITQAAQFKQSMATRIADTSAGITRWQRQHSFYSGGYQHKDYAYLTPDLNMQTQQTSQAKLAAAQPYQQFNYPGNYQTSVIGKRYAEQQFAAQELAYDCIQGNIPNPLKNSVFEKMCLNYF